VKGCDVAALNPRSQAPYDPREFFHLATKLVDDTHYDEESRRRTAVGRAYYSAFLFARKRLQDLGKGFSSDYRVHEEVITSLGEKTHLAGSQLNTLRDHRNDADYSMSADIHPQLCRTCLKLSERVISATESLK